MGATLASRTPRAVRGEACPPQPQPRRASVTVPAEHPDFHLNTPLCLWSLVRGPSSFRPTYKKNTAFKTLKMTKKQPYNHDLLRTHLSYFPSFCLLIAVSSSEEVCVLCVFVFLPLLLKTCKFDVSYSTRGDVSVRPRPPAGLLTRPAVRFLCVSLLSLRR